MPHLDTHAWLRHFHTLEIFMADLDTFIPDLDILMPDLDTFMPANSFALESSVLVSTIYKEPRKKVNLVETLVPSCSQQQAAGQYLSGQIWFKSTLWICETDTSKHSLWLGEVRWDCHWRLNSVFSTIHYFNRDKKVELTFFNMKLSSSMQMNGMA